MKLMLKLLNMLLLFLKLYFVKYKMLIVLSYMMYGQSLCDLYCEQSDYIPTL